MTDPHSPVIGITRCSRLDDYVASVQQSGASARVLEVNESPRALLARIDGLLLTGGGDVNPAFYSNKRHPTVHDAEPGRDEFGIDLARRAMDQDLPVLAICRGAQVMNVAAGEYVQDIPSAVAGALTHTVAQPKDARAHHVHVAHRGRCWSAPSARRSPRQAVRRQQPSPSVGRPARQESRHRRDRGGRRDRGNRVTGRALLRRRAVAPGELLPDGTVQTAVRRLRQRGARPHGIRSRVGRP